MTQPNATVESIAVPDVLAAGRWSHSVICTYNVDLALYERALWPRLGARNCVLLADAAMLIDGIAHAGRLRHAGVRYVLEPITGAMAAHAKLIWLSNDEEGALLVGSGNLSATGYAGAGELFCHYRHTPGDEQDLAAFQGARAFLDELVSSGHIDGQVSRHLDRIWLETPWLHRPAPGPATLRHNLTRPLLAQIAELVGHRPVERLVVHAPFWDRAGQALRALIDALRPGAVTILNRPGFGGGS